MIRDSVKIQVPATVANVACGFDLLGYAINEPTTEVTIKKNNSSKIEITFSGYSSNLIPTDPEKNTAGRGITSLLNQLNLKQGFTLNIDNGCPIGSGLGSSAASAVGGVFGANLLLGSPLSQKDLLPHCIKGEAIASGSEHADNVAPALFGGIILIQSYSPLRYLSLPVPEDLLSIVVLPELIISTKIARALIPKNIPMKTSLQQSSYLATFVASLYKNDFTLLGQSLKDLIAEPHRQGLIPGFQNIKSTIIDSGAIGCGISGSGPAIFALSNSEFVAENIAKGMEHEFRKLNIPSKTYISKIKTTPPIIAD